MRLAKNAWVIEMLAGLMWHTIQCKSWVKFEREPTISGGSRLSAGSTVALVRAVQAVYEGKHTLENGTLEHA
jgi:hypothetical protein